MKTKSREGSGLRDGFVFKYCLSCISASVAECVTFPLDITKTRLQIQGEKASLVSGAKVQPYRGMVKTAYGIAKEEGFLLLWRGITPAVLRHLVYSGSRMGAYEVIREKVLLRNKDGSFPLWKAVIGGMSSGAIGQFLASPTDLVKVQMQMEGRRILEGKPPRYRGTAHAFSSIVKQSGVRGLWKGWLPNVQRAALVNLG
ncbi:mitochondrial uncoupling 4-like, partial [Paramuricea clavata]